jgi:hypothetical protein
MRIIVTGSRDWTDRNVLYRALDDRAPGFTALGLTLAQGLCPTGADALARQWARDRLALVADYPADWTRLGPAAGPIRNKEMVDAGADLCLAFVNRCRASRCTRPEIHGSHGATNCAELATAAGIETRIFKEGW